MERKCKRWLVRRLSQSHKSDRCSQFAVSDSLRQLRGLDSCFTCNQGIEMFDGIIIKNNRTIYRLSPDTLNIDMRTRSGPFSIVAKNTTVPPENKNDNKTLRADESFQSGSARDNSCTDTCTGERILHL